MSNHVDYEQARSYCQSLDDVVEDHPFGPEPLVFKIGDERGKIFALLTQGESANISLKCDPDRAEMLREQYPAITAGYHLNKRHWNTIVLDGSVPDEECLALISHSYDLVRPKRRKAKA
ncbi:MmcQ/YjbR family DNA-binding protein [Herpetosiphon llansteffanensis]|uniref:MmcQ/YjbR family DNA-binding protein n=1 Tax=Herpetosiphon llansteffanensis TaxID=2094568 RepID=UPI000D7C2991|nr:MmcQ/YjbR family DNA-binding protein [Herpetosiphon llansteffanensis]